MNAIVYLSTSKNKRCLDHAMSIEGDKFEIIPKKRYKTTFMQMFMYGYFTTRNKEVKYSLEEINYEKYDTVYIISPVWAGGLSQYMKQYLRTVPFKGKNVVVIGSSNGGHGKFFDSVENVLDSSNKIIEKQMYINGVLKD